MHLFGNKTLIFAIVVYSLIYLFFFPSFYGSIDENASLRNAMLLSQGQISVLEDEPFFACRSVLTSQGFVSVYPVGRSFPLIPFIGGGLSTVFFYGLIIHLLNFFIFFQILKKLNFNSIYSIFYLLFPTLVWESRTLNAELFVATLALTGLYFYLSRERFFFALFSGFLFGLAVFIREDAIQFWGVFCAALLLKKDKKIIPFAIGGLIAVILFFVFNNALLGEVSSRSETTLAKVSSYFSISNFLFDLPIYFLLLLAVFPLLILSPYLQKQFELKIEFFLLTISYFAFNAMFTEFVAFDFSLETIFTARLRYLVPLIAILLIAYAGFFPKLLEKLRLIKWEKPIFLLVLLVLFLGIIYASFIHDRFLDSRKTVLNQIQSVIPDSAWVIGSSDDCSYFLKNFLGNQGYFNVVPKSDLGTTYSDFNILEYAQGRQLYVLDLTYSNLSKNTSTRQTVIDHERSKLKEFIEIHSSELSLVYETKNPHSLKIYRFKEGFQDEN
ncbi:MAG: hypothetical protein Q7S92_02455 [Candidatus Diapherotrites archaeon]|nr:hypothetical protein [Candidatus Diapherotrites archaeon]